MTRRVAIVGAGAAGTAALWAVVRHRAADAVHIIDPGEPGRGVVFDSEHDLLRCNTSAGVMSLNADNSDDFVSYLRGVGHGVSADDFVARGLFRDYAISCFGHAEIESARTGIDIDYRRAKATRVVPTGQGIGRDGRCCVRLDDGSEVVVDQVLLTPGVGAPFVPEFARSCVGASSFFSTPYPAERLLESLPSGARVLVIGTRLSAIDAALTLSASGHHVTLTSRSGELPSVRTSLRHSGIAPLDTAALDDLAVDGDHVHVAVLRVIRRATRGLEDLQFSDQCSVATDPVSRLREELDIANCGRSIWQETIAELIDYINERLGSVDDPAARGIAMWRGRRLVSRYISAMPAPNARLLLDLFQADSARVVKGTISALELEDGTTWSCGWNDGRRLSFDAVVCATGFDPPPVGVDAGALTLSAAAVDRSLAPRIDQDLRLRLPTASASENIRLLGTASFTRVPIVNYVRTAVLQAERVARDISESCSDAF